MSRNITNKKSAKSRKKKDEEENEVENPVVEDKVLLNNQTEHSLDQSISHLEKEFERMKEKNEIPLDQTEETLIDKKVLKEKEQESQRKEQYNFFSSDEKNNSNSQTVNILQGESGLRNRNYQSTDSSSKRFLSEKQSIVVSLENFISFCKTQFKINKEIMIIIIYIAVSFSLLSFEFLYGLIYSQVDIISDCFFNMFKSSAFLITASSILLSKYFSNLANLLGSRIELIAALSNVGFLVIVSLYRILEALHSIEEESVMSEGAMIEEKSVATGFFRTLGVFKVMLDTSFLIVFSDYLIHPSLQVRLQQWKKYRAWKRFDEVSLTDLKSCSDIIRNWNNHFENMNALLMNIVSDLLSNVLFFASYDITHFEYFDKINLIVSFISLIFSILLIIPLVQSIIQILLQGDSSLLFPYSQQLQKEITYFEGVLALQTIKVWMISQNEIKIYLQILVQRNINKTQLRSSIDDLSVDLGVNIDLVLETISSA